MPGLRQVGGMTPLEGPMPDLSEQELDLHRDTQFRRNSRNSKTSSQKTEPNRFQPISHGTTRDQVSSHESRDHCCLTCLSQCLSLNQPSHRIESCGRGIPGILTVMHNSGIPVAAPWSESTTRAPYSTVRHNDIRVEVSAVDAVQGAERDFALVNMVTPGHSHQGLGVCWTCLLLIHPDSSPPYDVSCVSTNCRR